MRVLDEWLLTAERVAVHLPSATAVVADLHLGYSEARRRGGESVPRDSLDEQLSGLRRVAKQHGTRRLVVAGDLLEDARCHTVITAFRDWLQRANIELVTVAPGNHDLGLEMPSIANPPFALAPEGVTLGGWQVVHGDGPLPEDCVVHGHEHPYLRWAAKTRAMRPRFFGGLAPPVGIEGACYLVAPRHLVLPAFSKDAAGVNVLPARRWRAYRCLVIAGERVLDLGELATLRSRLTAADYRRSAGWADSR